MLKSEKEAAIKILKVILFFSSSAYIGKPFFCPSLFTQTKQKPMHRCEWRYYEETFQLFLSLSLDMLDLNSTQFHSGIKEKKSASKCFSRGEEQLRFFLNFLTLSCLKNNLLIVRNTRIKK